jgi:hypothetical protein
MRHAGPSGEAMRIPVLLVPFALVACGGGGGGGPTEAAINITSSGFASNVGSNAITIPTGGRVHFFNKDSANHQVVSTSTGCSDLDTPLLMPGQDSLRPTMTGPLSCVYQDQNNSSLTGTVTVNAPSAGGGGGGGGSGY